MEDWESVQIPSKITNRTDLLKETTAGTDPFGKVSVQADVGVPNSF